jgi:hypothetical protein
MTRTAGTVLALAAPLVILAFWPMYLSRPFATIDRYTHLHALSGSLWFLLLLAQPLAIQQRRFALHRALGHCSYVVAPLFVIAGVLLSHHRLASMSDETFATDGFSHYLPFYASLIFAVAYLYGLRYRHVAQAHGRFMLLTAMPLIDPVVGRVLFFYLPQLPAPWLYQALTFTVATAVAALLVFSYHGQAAARRALVTYFVLLVVLELGWFTIALTAPWLHAVGWFRSLPLT